MTTTKTGKLHAPHPPQVEEEKKRSPIRQQLVETERGMTLGFRADSTFFVHFFTGSIVVAVAIVLGLTTLQWTILILSLTLVLSAEMFLQVIKNITQSIGHHFEETAKKSERIGTAAVFVTILGTVLAIGLIFGQRLTELYGD